MTYQAFATRAPQRPIHTAYDDPRYAGVIPARRPSRARSYAALCAVGLAFSTSVGLWMLYGQPADVAPQVTASLTTPPVAAPRPAERIMPKAALPRRIASGPSILSPDYSSGYAAETFARSTPVEASLETASGQLQIVALEPPAAEPEAIGSETTDTAVADPAVPTIVPPAPVVSEIVRDVPMPMPRPAALSATPDAPMPASPSRRRLAQIEPQPVAPGTQADHRSFFDRLFRPQSAPGTALAYAAPNDGSLGPAALRTAPDRWTAVYNIAAHTVTLPDGTRLEAHSGIGDNKDNPGSVALHMRGATPPAVYDLTPREALFHGVRALRLNPVGDVPPYGRMGLLAHTYMLGPRGDSNGCVVFRDYASFRRAYDEGSIRRLVVVAGG